MGPAEGSRLEPTSCLLTQRLSLWCSYVTPTFQPTADAMCRFTPQLIEQCLLHIGECVTVPHGHPSRLEALVLT